MDDEIHLISDGNGLAVIGKPTDVERFLTDQGLDQTPSKDLDLRHLGSFLGGGGAVAQVGSELVENSGRWVKLTKESAKTLKEFGPMPTKTPGVSHAMIGQPGSIKKWLQIETTPGAHLGGLLGGPMALSALSTMMQQRAMQQQMDEIVDYLEEINEKVDDILRSQKDAVLADMIGVDLVIEEALTVRDQVGRVSEVTWSKIQLTAMTIARTQAYALRQLDMIAEKLEKKSDLGVIAEATKEAEPKVKEWLAVLARCFQLQDGVSVLELDRVLDTSPEDLDQHRIGLMAAQRNRLELIARSTARLLAQMDKTIQKANSKVMFNPFDSPSAVRSSNCVADTVLQFRERLEIESDHQTAEAKRWGQAATEALDKAVTTGTEGLGAVRRFGTETFDHVADAFRAVDTDGDGIPDRPKAAQAVGDVGSAIKSFIKRKQDTSTPQSDGDAEVTD